MCALFVSVYLEVYGRYFPAGSTVVSWTIEHIGIALAQWWKDNPLKGAASCILLIEDVKSNTVQPKRFNNLASKLQVYAQWIVPAELAQYLPAPA